MQRECLSPHGLSPYKQTLYLEWSVFWQAAKYVFPPLTFSFLSWLIKGQLGDYHKKRLPQEHIKNTEYKMLIIRGESGNGRNEPIEIIYFTAVSDPRILVASNMSFRHRWKCEVVTSVVLQINDKLIKANIKKIFNWYMEIWDIIIYYKVTSSKWCW